MTYKGFNYIDPIEEMLVFHTNQFGEIYYCPNLIERVPNKIVRKAFLRLSNLGFFKGTRPYTLTARGRALKKKLHEELLDNDVADNW